MSSEDFLDDGAHDRQRRCRVRTTNPGELAAAAKQAVERRRSLVIGVPVNYADYRRF